MYSNKGPGEPGVADIWTDPKPPGREGTHIYTYTRGRGDEGYTYLFFQFGETRAYIYIYVHNIRLYAPCGAAVDPPARVKVLAHVYIYIRTYVQDFYHIRVYILWQACVNARVFFHSLFRPPENICRSFVCDQRAAAAAMTVTMNTTAPPPSKPDHTGVPQDPRKRDSERRTRTRKRRNLGVFVLHM